MTIDGILRRQGGVISRDQAIAAGLAPSLVDRRLRRRQWRPVHPQVYLATSRPAGPEARVRAALLWAGPGAVLAGAAAAWWCGLLQRPPPTVTVLVPGPPARAPAGITVWSDRLDPADLAEHRGLPLTAPARTLLDTAVELGPAGTQVIDRVLRSGPRPGGLSPGGLSPGGLSPGGLSPAELHAAARRHPIPGARRQLAAAGDRSAEAARRALRQLLLDAGLPGWRPVAGPVAAARFPAARLTVEIIGWAQLPEAPDPRTAPGWTVHRHPWSTLATRPGEVLDRITAVVIPRGR